MFVGKAKGWSEATSTQETASGHRPYQRANDSRSVFDGMQPFVHFLEDVKIQIPSEFTWGSNWLGWR